MKELQYLYYFLYTLSFILGIVVGVTIALSSITRKIMSKVSTKTNEDYENISDDKKQIINEKITNTYDHYLKMQQIKSKNSRLVFRKKIYPQIEDPMDLKRLIVEIAKVFYPESNEPLLELSINEVFDLIKRITIRLDDTFNATKLSFVRYLKLSSVYMMLGLFNKINSIKNNKFMKLVLRTINFSVFISNMINPIALLRDQTKRKVNKSFTSFLIENTCKIVGKETACIYSKNLLVKKDTMEVVLLPENDN